MIIDTHAHLVAESFNDDFARRASEFPSVAVTPAGKTFSLSFNNGKPTRPVSPKLIDMTERMRWANSREITHQVVGGWLDMFGYELPAEEGARWSRFLNEQMLQGIERQGWLVPLATVPLQDGRLAAEVLKDAMGQGFHGAMIGTQPKGTSGALDDPDLDPFWQTASDLGATLFLHPMFGCDDPRLHDFGLMNGVGRGMDTSIAVARLLFSGHLLRYEGLKMILSHGGGALPYMLGRLMRNYDIHNGEFANPRDGFAKLYFDSVVFDPAALRFLCEVAGADKVVLGSDYPFPIGDLEKPLDVVGEAGFDEATTRNILGNTAAKLFHIEGGCNCGRH